MNCSKHLFASVTKPKQASNVCKKIQRPVDWRENGKEKMYLLEKHPITGKTVLARSNDRDDQLVAGIFTGPLSCFSLLPLVGSVLHARRVAKGPFDESVSVRQEQGCSGPI